jgi:hypothetical protein
MMALRPTTLSVVSPLTLRIVSPFSRIPFDAGKRVAEPGERRGDRVFLRVLHVDGCLLVRLLHGLADRVDRVERQHGLAAVEPGLDHLEPARRLFAVADNVHGEHVERAARRVGLLARDLDERHLLVVEGHGAEGVEHGARLLDHIGGRHEGEAERSHEGADEQSPPDPGGASAAGRADRGIVGEDRHRCPFG